MSSTHKLYLTSLRCDLIFASHLVLPRRFLFLDLDPGAQKRVTLTHETGAALRARICVFFSHQSASLGVPKGVDASMTLLKKTTRTRYAEGVMIPAPPMGLVR
jgi:hypothetical protein